MKNLKDILEAKPIVLNKCKYCGREYKVESMPVFKGTQNEKILHFQVPACDCEEKARLAEEERRKQAARAEMLAQKFNNSLITPYFKDIRFNTLEKQAAKFGNEKEIRILKNYAHTFDKSEHKGIFLIGNAGTGKTTLLAAVCNDLIECGYNCLFTTLSELMEKFGAYSFEHYGDIHPLLMWLIKFDFVVIDDIGRENYTDRRKEIVFRIFDTILNYRVTAGFSANFETIARLNQIPDWHAILDRLKDICALQMQFKGESQRGRAWL